MIPAITGEIFDSLKWKDIEAKDIDKVIEGLTVIGANDVICGYETSKKGAKEIVSDVIIYFREKDGSILALDIGAAYYDTEPGENPFFAEIARFKE